MNKLRELQQHFEMYLLNADKTIQNEIEKPMHGRRNARLSIYANGYRWRLIEALGKRYEILKKHMGDDAFYTLGEAYLQANPPQHFLIADFGEFLPEFLEKEHPYCRQPHLSELAVFIRALSDTVEKTQNITPITQEHIVLIAQEDWPYMHFKLHPAVNLINYQWNVIDLWQSLTQKEKSPITIRKELTHCVFWRKGIESYYRKIDVKEKWVLESIKNNQSFAMLCEGLLLWISQDKIPEYLISHLLAHLRDGMLIDITVNRQSQ